jgi:hypothetical protein
MPAEPLLDTEKTRKPSRSSFDRKSRSAAASIVRVTTSPVGVPSRQVNSAIFARTRFNASRHWPAAALGKVTTSPYHSTTGRTPTTAMNCGLQAGNGITRTQSMQVSNQTIMARSIRRAPFGERAFAALLVGVLRSIFISSRVCVEVLA